MFLVFELADDDGLRSLFLNLSGRELLQKVRAKVRPIAVRISGDNGSTTR